MSSATDGDTDYLAVEYLRRPISVAELLEREGYTPAGRRAARRALSGVTAGAVLALGAVVGTLFFHGERTAGDSLATGNLAQSGGDIVLAETSSTPQTPHQATTPSPTKQAPKVVQLAPKASNPAGSRVGADDFSWDRTDTATPANPAPAATGTAGAMSPAATATTAPTTQPATPSTGSSATSTTSPTTGVTSKSTGTSTTTPPAPSTPTTSSPAPSTTTTTQTPPTTGGLLGTVGGVLGAVTQPAFDWFG